MHKLKNTKNQYYLKNNDGGLKIWLSVKEQWLLFCLNLIPSTNIVTSTSSMRSNTFLCFFEHQAKEAYTLK